MKYPKRLIEVDLPISRISAHARREKSIRHGHISTLHIWWARRPLAACRAVICASLWPDPTDELCPPAFREAAATQLMAFAHRMFPAKITEEGRQLQATVSTESRGRWEGLLQSEKDGLPLDPTDTAHQQVLQGALLDFIADFANWDNSTVPAYLETSRALTQAAHEALGGVPGTRPLVVDPFAGGGSIPLEALRVGGDAFASDLNPIPVLLNKVVLEYIPKYGQKLADEVRKWGEWVKSEAVKELEELYPKDSDGAIPIAYLWARTIVSEAPGQGDIPVEVPLIRSLWLSRKPKRRIALRWVRNAKGEVQTDIEEVSYADGTTRKVCRPRLEVFRPNNDREVEEGTVARGSATCPVTGFTTPIESVRSQIKSRHGGASDARLFCVVTASNDRGMRDYRLPNDDDLKALELAVDRLSEMDSKPDVSLVIPDEPSPRGGGRGAGRAFSQTKYGMDLFRDIFTPRQLFGLSTLGQIVRRAGNSVRVEADDAFADATQAILSLCASKLSDVVNSLCSWQPTNDRATHLFARQGIQVTWDFSESCLISDAVGDFGVAIKNIVRILDREQNCFHEGTVEQASADSHPLPNDSAQGFISDPPYYDAVPYSDLSDFFYVWLKRSLSKSLIGGFSEELAPKESECIVDEIKGKDHSFFTRTMTNALAEARRVLAPSGVGVVVFAHKSTSGWESQLQAMVDAGWTITGSWPIDTEWGTRLRAMNSAALASSVHLVCRPRENADGSLREETGEWRDILSELPQRVHEWMPRLAAEGVVGADAIFACLGPALEIFSRYSRVEKASGEAVPLREYLEQVWATVSTEALSMIFKDADAAGLEPDARLTAMWLWTLGGMETNGSDSKSSSDSDEKVVASKGYTLEYDAARKIAQGLGVHLEQSDSIVEVSGDKARLLPVSERTRHLFGNDEATTTPRGKKKKAKAKQLDLFKTLDEIEAEAEETIAGELKPQAGETVLDRVHQSMILFASGRGEALRRFLVDDGAGNDARFWKLAQSLSALYPKETDEKRWVDGVLARKKGLGL